MQAQATLCFDSLEATIAHIFVSRCITRQDQQLLMHFGAQVIQDQRALKLINSVFDALRQGFLRVVD